MATALVAAQCPRPACVLYRQVLVFLVPLASNPPTLEKATGRGLLSVSHFAKAHSR